MSTARRLEEAVEAAAAVEQEYCGGIIASEVSSSYPAEATGGARRLVGGEDEGEIGWGGGGGVDGENEADLELGLSLGVTKAPAAPAPSHPAGGGVGGTVPWRDYCRILTAKDFPPMVASRGSPISSSSSSASSPNHGGGGRVAAAGVSGTKRAADSASPPGKYLPPSQVVGWPPVRAYRINTLMNNSKNNSDDGGGKDERRKKASGEAVADQSAVKQNPTGKDPEKKGPPCWGSRFVKVKMDGMPIGRKVDLSSHRDYETLALILEDMFEEHCSLSNLPSGRRTLKLLDGASEFVLTYEDKDGDWLLVGDVPWGMFVSSVKRLRIMRTSDARGLRESPLFPPLMNSQIIQMSSGFSLHRCVSCIHASSLCFHGSSLQARRYTGRLERPGI